MATSEKSEFIDRYSRPTQRDLHSHVLPDVCTKWYDLGLELLDPKDDKKLSTIETDSIKEGVEKCCKKMFAEWLNYKNISWDKLVQAIRKIGLNHTASQIEKLFEGAPTPAVNKEKKGDSNGSGEDAQQKSIFSKKPEMWQLNQHVIPLIRAHWEDVAYNSFHYSIQKVEGIESQYKNDTKKCCQELFKLWLSTKDEGDPKDWQTLLKQLKEVPELTASVEEIKKKLGTL